MDVSNVQTDAKLFVASLDKMKAETYELASAIDNATEKTYAMAHSEDSSATQTNAYVASLTRYETVLRLIKTSTDDASQSVTRLGVATASAGGASGNYQQRIQGLGYAMNDFTSVQGDMSARLNAISNNMPMLLAGFGGLGLALSAILPTVGIIIKEWDKLIRAFQSQTPISDTILNVRELNKVFEAHREELDKLKALQTLTNWEQNRYNELLKITGQEEATLDAKRAAEASKKAPKAAETERAKANVATRDQVGGQAFEADVRAAMKKVTPGATPEVLQAQVEGFIQKFLAGDERATNLMADRPKLFGGTGMAFDEVRDRPGAEERAEAYKKIQDQKFKALQEKFKNEEKEAEKEKERQEKGFTTASKWAGEENAWPEKRAAEAQKQEAKENRDLAADVRSKMAEAKRKVDEANSHTGTKNRTADAIEQGTGGQITGNDLAEATNRSLQLQRQHIDATTANQQAVMEQDAKMRGMEQELRMLQANAEQVLRAMKGHGRARGQADNNPTQLNVGPGS